MGLGLKIKNSVDRFGRKANATIDKFGKKATGVINRVDKTTIQSLINQEELQMH